MLGARDGTASDRSRRPGDGAGDRARGAADGRRVPAGPLVGMGGRAAGNRGWLGPAPARGLSSKAMRLAFRQRIFLILICLGAVPTAVAILGWAFTVRSTTPAVGALRAIEDVGASGRTLLQTLDSTRLTPAERRALA